MKAAAVRRRTVEELCGSGQVGDLLREIKADRGDGDPLGVLVAAMDRAAAMVELLGLLVDGLDIDGDGVSIASTTPRLTGLNRLGDGAPHVYLALLGEWLDRAAKISKAALDAGVDDRLAAVAEQQGRQLVEVLQGAVTDVRDALRARGVDVDAAIEAEVIADVPRFVAHRLRALKAPDPATP